MLALHKLDLKNFMAISSASFEFPDKGAVVFSGDNGSGKSAVFEAVALCFTERRRGDSYKDFIKKHQVEAIIHLEATLKNLPIVFDICIQDKKGVTPLARTIQYDNQTYKNSECTTFLSTFDIEYLQQVIFSLQGESDITSLGPVDRTKVLKKLFGFEFSDQLAALTTTIDTLTNNQVLLRQRVDILSQQKFIYQALVDTAPPDVLSSWKKELASKEEHLHTLQAEHRLLENKESGGQLLRYKLEAELTQLRAAKETQAKLSQELASVRLTIQKLTLDKKTWVQKLEDYSAPLATDKNQLDKAHEDLSSDILRLQADKLSLEAERNRIDRMIEEHARGVCSSCGQHTTTLPVTDLEDRKSRVDLDIQQGLSLLEEKRTRLGSLGQEIQLANQAIAFQEKNRREAQLRLESLEANLKAAKGVEEVKLKELSTVDLKVAAVEETVATYRNAVTEAEGNSTQSFQLAEIASKIAQISADIKLLTKQLHEEELNQTTNAAIEKANKQQEESERLVTSQIRTALEQLGKEAAELATAKEARVILETHLPNYVIVKRCAKLEDRLNAFISTVMEGMRVRLFQSRKGVEFFYFPDGDDPSKEASWMPTKMASGFEKELLSIAWRVALAEEFGLPILILDEIDSAAKDESSELTFRALASCDSFDQLFIVSHTTDILDVLTQEAVAVSAYEVSKGTFTPIIY